MVNSIEKINDHFYMGGPNRGGGSGSGVKHGFYDSGHFYEDPELTKPMTVKDYDVILDLFTGSLYGALELSFPSDTLNWDGNTQGAPTFVFNGVSYYRVTDYIPFGEGLEDSEMSVDLGDGTLVNLNTASQIGEVVYQWGSKVIYAINDCTVTHPTLPEPLLVGRGIWVAADVRKVVSSIEAFEEMRMVFEPINASNLSVLQVQYEDPIGGHFGDVLGGMYAIISVNDGDTFHTILPVSNYTRGWLLQDTTGWRIADNFGEEGFDEETTWAALVSWLSEHSTAIGGGAATPYISLERLRKYLYRVTFDSLPGDDSLDSSLGGACSSFVQNGKLYRNLDFKYDNAASFIVRTKDFEGMSFLTGLDDGALSDALVSQLPFHVVDGRNNSGIMVSAHVIFNDWNYTGCGNKSIPITKLPFLVLTNVKSMATIADDLNGVLENVKVTEGMGDYLLQVLVTDGTTTYAIIPPEADNFDYVLVDASSNPKMANFRWLSSATVARDDADMQDRPTGVERYNMMPCDLADLQFTLCYESANRLSEFIGINGTDKDSTDAELTAIYDSARQEYLSRERDGATWQTMHSVVYGSKMESLFIQEDWTDNCVNVGGSAEGAVIYSEAQSLTDGQKTQARANIGAASDADVTELEQEVGEIVDVIPAQASAQNQVADKAFVNSSIQTASANFRGNWATKSAIPTDYTQYPADYLGNKKPTTNDYLVVQADESQGGGTWRYKYSGDWDTDGISGWNAEYEVNETPLTAAQLAALNSGATAAAIAQIAQNTADIAGKEGKNIIDSDTETTAVSEAMVVGKTYKYRPSAGVATLAFTLTAPTETDVVKFWRFKFKSGATATEFTPPSGLYWPEGEVLIPEANTIYEVMIDEDYCVSVLAFKQATV